MNAPSRPVGIRPQKRNKSEKHQNVGNTLHRVAVAPSVAEAQAPVEQYSGYKRHLSPGKNLAQHAAAYRPAVETAVYEQARYCGERGNKHEYRHNGTRPGNSPAKADTEAKPLPRQCSPPAVPATAQFVNQSLVHTYDNKQSPFFVIPPAQNKRHFQQ